MPEVHPSKVVSYSSEDKAFPAQNLLKASSFSKWLSEKGGTKQEVVELGFDQPVEICRLDIGNNGSAFIEVLVRRSASTDGPKVFLPSSSFLSPTEAKSETNLTRVRVFSGDELQSTTASEKWDIFRFVCLQPFNKTLPYGMSFVSFHAPTPKTEESTRPTANLSVVDAEPDNEESLDFKPGALFRARKDQTPVEVTNAVSPKSLSVTGKLLLAQRSSSSQRTSSSLTTQPSTSAPTPPRSSVSHPTEQRNSTKADNPQVEQTSKRTKNESQGSVPVGAVPSPAPSSSASKPLDGVIFSLSGYQNPLRSEIRRKALELGAKFRQDWSADCTHLVCAFANTPKFKEVKGKGIIVSDKWIETCHRTRSRVDWRPYRVGGAPSPRAPSNPPVVSSSSRIDSEEEESSGSPRPPKRRKKLRPGYEDDEDWDPGSENTGDDDDGEEEEEEDANASDSKHTDDDDDSGQRTKQRKKPVMKRRSTASSSNSRYAKTSARSSGAKPAPTVNPEDEDTDDEIERALSPAKNGTPISPGDQATSSAQSDLPDTFEGKHFFIHNKAIAPDEERLLRRLIVAFNGTLHDYMHSDVQYVVTRSIWNEEFDEALSANASIIFVRPEWIFSCDREAKWMPFHKFLVVG